MSALHPINQETTVSALGALGRFFPTRFPFPPDPVLPSQSRRHGPGTRQPDPCSPWRRCSLHHLRLLPIRVRLKLSLPKHLQVAARMDQHELGKLHSRSR
ncbi:hypothetical protein SETIT_4G192000v2 [Setaria italica]|uniref:Uncharacterized protein n=1 Tax=Setaria italica TaxID=4555 RepID=A0A368QVU3_SETIT|nr:hypothetical protein SETIT_4G192000v2 [Setaria italica]